jgi:hypothetical protein
VAVTAALLLLTVCQGAAALLVVSGRRHRRNRPLFTHHLRAHGVVPRWAIGAVSRVTPVASLGAGAAVLTGPLLVAAVEPGRWPVAARVAAGVLAVVYLMFLAYLTALHRRAPGTPCGCLGAGDERSGSSVTRAAVVVLVSGIAAAASWPPAALTGVPGWPLLVLLATAVGVGAAALVAGPAVPAPGAPLTTFAKELT